MNRILIILAFKCASLSLLSQNYTSFFSDTTQYNIVNKTTCKNSSIYDAFTPCIATNMFYIIKTNQLSFNEKDYIVAQGQNGDLFNPGIYSEGLIIREDTTGKIFRYFPSIDNELLICDMSLNQGDTFQLFSFINETSYLENFYIEEGVKLIVDTVTYVNGQKVIHFPNISSSVFYNNLFWQFDISIKFIEGVGPTYGPFGYYNFLGFEKALPLLLCKKNNSQLTFMQHGNLGCIQNSVSIEENKISNINIFPNPTNGFINIDLNMNHNEYTLNVCNIYGIVIYFEKISENSVIDLTNFPPGIYFLYLKSNQSVVYVKKIIIN